MKKIGNSGSNGVKITVYRWEGRFGFLRIRSECEECDLTTHLLSRLQETTFRDRPVSLTILPWLDNWWRILWRGAWHAPVVMIAGRIFSQGIVPDEDALVRRVLDSLEPPLAGKPPRP